MSDLFINILFMRFSASYQSSLHSTLHFLSYLSSSRLNFPFNTHKQLSDNAYKQQCRGVCIARAPSVPQCSGMFHDILECSGMFHNVFEHDHLPFHSHPPSKPNSLTLLSTLPLSSFSPLSVVKSRTQINVTCTPQWMVHTSLQFLSVLVTIHLRYFCY